MANVTVNPSAVRRKFAEYVEWRRANENGVGPEEGHRAALLWYTILGQANKYGLIRMAPVTWAADAFIEPTEPETLTPILDFMLGPGNMMAAYTGDDTNQYAAILNYQNYQDRPRHLPTSEIPAPPPYVVALLSPVTRSLIERGIAAGKFVPRKGGKTKDGWEGRVAGETGRDSNQAG